MRSKWPRKQLGKRIHFRSRRSINKIECAEEQKKWENHFLTIKHRHKIGRYTDGALL